MLYNKKIRLLIISLSLALTPLANADGHKATEHMANDRPTDNNFWWPNRLDLDSLRQHNIKSNPYGEDFDYKTEFQSLDISAVKDDLRKTLTTSQDWWPADYGHYGPFFIRMAWHSAGVYRIFDGRGGASGGQQRFEPLNSWPDNANLDKARRLLWPVKQKYGRKISWADLIVLAGNVSLEDMGFNTFGYAGGRADDWESEKVNWGLEKKWLGNGKRYKSKKDREFAKPLAAVEMGLIYVNPEGPHGIPDPLASAKNIRISFGRMAMNDEETVALIAGGHTFGKAHGARSPKDCVGKEPAAAAIEEQGLGWKNRCKSGKGTDTITSGLEGAWTVNPIQWTSNYVDNLLNFEWVLTKSPAGAKQWKPKNSENTKFVPDAFDKNKRHAPIMFTTDIALKMDPEYNKVITHFQKDSKAFAKAFARAWFKLTHRDMGPRARYLGADIPNEMLIWQDPIPVIDYELVSATDVKKLKKSIAKSGLSNSQLVRTAWASASTFRGTDMRGGANGARIQLAPQKNWAANNPKELATVLSKLSKIQKQFNKKSKRKVSMADLIVLAGAYGIENAAKNTGLNVSVPFTAGRNDTTQALTDTQSFAVLNPVADGFRNYYSSDAAKSPSEMLIEKANYLTLSVPEMTVLVGGMRSLGANADNSKNGVFTKNIGQLSNDFFVNLLDMSTQWKKSPNTKGLYIGIDSATGTQKWQATPVDLIFGSNSELRSVAEAYASNDAKQQFADDFVAAWVKVMNLDRF